MVYVNEGVTVSCLLKAWKKPLPPPQPGTFQPCPQALLLENCLVLGTDNVHEHIPFILSHQMEGIAYAVYTVCTF